MVSLLEQQQKFSRMVENLLTWCHYNHYEVTFGETYRTPEEAELNVQRHTGISKSLHTQRLAIDLNFFIIKDGQQLYLNKEEEYLPIAVFWESIGGSWGGRFLPIPDCDHFSLTWQGIK